MDNFEFLVKYKALDDEIKSKVKERDRMKKKIIHVLHEHGSICYRGIKAQIVQRERNIIDKEKLEFILEENFSFVEKTIKYEELVISEEKLIF